MLSTIMQSYAWVMQSPNYFMSELHSRIGSPEGAVLYDLNSPNVWGWKCVRFQDQTRGRVGEGEGAVRRREELVPLNYL